MAETEQEKYQRLIWGDILNERWTQDERWGPPNHTDLEWLSILTKQVGQIAGLLNAAMPEMDAPRYVCGKMQHELTQAAAVLVAWMENRKTRARCFAEARAEEVLP